MSNSVLRRFLRPYRRQLAAVVLLQILGTLATLFLPALNADVIDVGIANGDSGYIVATGARMLGVTLVQVVCQVGVGYFGARVAMSFGRDVRNALVHRIGAFSAVQVNTLGAPSLVVRTTNDVQQVQLLVLMACTVLVAAPVTCVVGLVMALYEDVGLSWLLLVCLPISLLSTGLVVIRMVPGSRRLQEQLDGLNRILREQLTGFRVVRAFVREPAETARATAAADSLMDTALRVGRLQALTLPIALFVLYASSAATLWFGARRVETGEMHIGALIAFLSYLLQILAAVVAATFLSMMIPRASVSAERIAEVLGGEPSIRPRPASSAAAPERGRVEFQGVEFGYPGAAEPVLRGVCLQAAAGSTTAIIGSTGSGKTTLLSLIPRLMDVTGGCVLVDGADVRDVPPDVLRSRIGLVPQRSYLFAGTVAGNLRYGDADATDEELWRALEAAQAHEFVAAMPGGLAAPIVPGGANVSGGERQRLAIARALVRKPEIYLFDDAFSALDPDTDLRLRTALRQWTRDAAMLVVAQRVASILDADTIIVLDNGSVIGTGTHTELLASCPTYVQIVESQLPPEHAA